MGYGAKGKGGYQGNQGQYGKGKGKGKQCGSGSGGGNIAGNAHWGWHNGKGHGKAQGHGGPSGPQKSASAWGAPSGGGYDGVTARVWCSGFCKNWVYKYKAGPSCRRCGGDFTDKAPDVAAGNKDEGRSQGGKKEGGAEKAEVAEEGSNKLQQLKVAVSSIKTFFEKANEEHGGKGELPNWAMGKLEGVLQEAFGIPVQEEKEEPKEPKSKRWRAARERGAKADAACTSLDKQLQKAEATEKELFEKLEKAKKATNEVRAGIITANTERDAAQKELEAVKAEPEEEERKPDMEVEKPRLGAILAAMGTPDVAGNVADDIPPNGKGGTGGMGITPPPPSGGKSIGKGSSSAHSGPYTKEGGPSKPVNEFNIEDLAMALTKDEQAGMGEECAKKLRDFQKCFEAEQEENKRRRLLHPSKEELETAKLQSDAVAEAAAKAAEEESKREAEAEEARKEEARKAEEKKQAEQSK